MDREPQQQTVHRRRLAALDDRVGNGNINPVKRWWQDLEVVGGQVRKPKLANARDLDLGKPMDPAKQKIAHYPAATTTPPDLATPFPPDRKRALAERLETPSAARARRRNGGPRPAIYEPPLARG